MPARPLILIGAGGHAKVLADVIQLEKRPTLGVVDADPSKHGKGVLGLLVLGGEEVILTRLQHTIDLVNAVGSVHSMTARAAVYERWTAAIYMFARIIHPSAIIARSASLGDGVQVLAGAVIQPEAKIGSNTIINTRVSVDHDSIIGAHCHLAPGVSVSGNVKIGDRTHVGVGASIVQGVTIGAGCLIAAGAVVIRDVPDGQAVCGVPAKPMKSR